MKFETKHWAVIAGMLIAVGTQIGGLEHGWHDALSPGFIGGLAIQLGTVLTAIYVGAPQKPYTEGKSIDRRNQPKDGE